MELVKVELREGLNLKAQLDIIDESVKTAAYQGYYWSRLNIIVGMWEKGKVVWEYRGVNSQNWYQLEKETGRDHKSLKKWYILYHKNQNKNNYIEAAKEQAKIWTDRVFKKELPKPETPPLPDETYQIIYADPPWSFRNEGINIAAKKQYPTMSVDDISNIEIGNIAAPQSVLFLWAVASQISEAIQVSESWGFPDIKTCIVWVKQKDSFGGWWIKTRHELLLICTKKESLKPKIKIDSVVEAPASKHSKKPEIFYELIEQMYQPPYIELFARNERPGWSSWGLEVE